MLTKELDVFVRIMIMKVLGHVSELDGQIITIVTVLSLVKLILDGSHVFK